MNVLARLFLAIRRLLWYKVPHQHKWASNYSLKISSECSVPFDPFDNVLLSIACKDLCIGPISNTFLDFLSWFFFDLFYNILSSSSVSLCNTLLFTLPMILKYFNRAITGIGTKEENIKVTAKKIAHGGRLTYFPSACNNKKNVWRIIQIALTWNILTTCQSS